MHLRWFLPIEQSGPWTFPWHTRIPKTTENFIMSKPQTRFPDNAFFKSSHSNANDNSNDNSNCVMVAIRDDVVAVRDSKDPTKTTLTFTRAEWSAFIAGVKGQEFEV